MLYQSQYLRKEKLEIDTLSWNIENKQGGAKYSSEMIKDLRNKSQAYANMIKYHEKNIGKR